MAAQPKGGPGGDKLSADEVRERYMASDFVEWGPFVKSMKWSHEITYSDAQNWVREKRDIIARREAEAIADAVFSHRGRWHKQVLDTLRDYPAASDAMMNVLRYRLNHYTQLAQQDQQARAKNPNAQTEFSRIETSELASLAAAIKITTETKHKSLMINDWSFKVAEAFGDPKQFHDAKEKQLDVEWKLELIGGGKIPVAEVQRTLMEFYDKPALPHAPEDVDAAAEQPGG